MATKISKKVTDRFHAKLKAFQQIAINQKTRDVSEADTVTVIKDMLAEMFGYDKYTELTSEHQIKGTYCDLAVKIDAKVQFLIEVKAAAIELNQSHIRQAVNYGVNEGITWVVLTNAIDWIIFKVKFGKPVETEEIARFSLLNINLKNEEDIDKLYLLCREGIQTDAMDAFHQHSTLFNKFTITQVLQSETVVNSIRKELKRLFPEGKIDNEAIGTIMVNEILKREVIEGEKVKEVQTMIKKIEQKAARAVAKKQAQAEQDKQVKTDE